MKIGVLTGGGDVPGLNPAIKTIVERGIEAGYEIVGIRRGWGGLLNYDLSEGADNSQWAMELDHKVVRRIARTGGTFLHTSRTNPSNVKAGSVPEFLRDENWSPDQENSDHTPHVLKVLERLGVDVLVAIGGDDTLSYADRMHREGVQVVAIPKTMDNDVSGTDYCIGFSTAVTRSVEFINNLRTSTGSHERIAVVELFGRNSGETSLIAAYLGEVDRAIISEVPFDPAKLADLLMEDKARNPSNYAIMTISEGATMLGGDIVQTGEKDAYGHQKLGGIGQMTSDFIKKHTGQNMIYQQVAYLMRSGPPDVLDVMVGFNYGNMAMDLIIKGQSGRMMALQNGVYVDIPITTVMQGARKVDVDAMYDSDAYRPRVRSVSGMPMFLR